MPCLCVQMQGTLCLPQLSQRLLRECQPNPNLDRQSSVSTSEFQSLPAMIRSNAEDSNWGFQRVSMISSMPRVRKFHAVWLPRRGALHKERIIINPRASPYLLPCR